MWWVTFAWLQEQTVQNKQTDVSPTSAFEYKNMHSISSELLSFYNISHASYRWDVYIIVYASVDWELFMDVILVAETGLECM